MSTYHFPSIVTLPRHPTRAYTSLLPPGPDLTIEISPRPSTTSVTGVLQSPSIHLWTISILISSLSFQILNAAVYASPRCTSSAHFSSPQQTSPSLTLRTLSAPGNANPTLADGRRRAPTHKSFFVIRFRSQATQAVSPALHTSPESPSGPNCNGFGRKRRDTLESMLLSDPRFRQGRRGEPQPSAIHSDPHASLRRRPDTSVFEPLPTD
jgi:hypothetical protein